MLLLLFWLQAIKFHTDSAETDDSLKNSDFQMVDEVLDDGEVCLTIFYVPNFLILLTRNHRIRWALKALRLKKEMEIRKK